MDVRAEQGLDTGVELTAARRLDRSRYFFVGVGAVCILVALVGFGPSLYKHVRGDRFIPLIVHVHAAIMMGWVVLYTVQAGLAAHENLYRHRQLGCAAIVLAVAVWISMGVATIVALQRFDPDEFGFIVKPLLIQLGTMVVFPVFVTWGVLARRHTDWHQRLMTFATFALIQAALDRMDWLPNEGLPMFWHYGLRLYILMIPLFAFDIVTLRRIHPATLIGWGIIIAMHGVVSFYWKDEGWNQLARSLWISLR
jgi:hypothetical protein